MAIPPRDKSMQGLLKDIVFRLALVERRLLGTSRASDDDAWINMATTVAWAAGWSFIADGGGHGGLKARRVGNTVDFVIANARAAAGTFQIPVTGNITNSLIFSGVPAKYRPASGGIVGFVSGPAGPIVSIYMNSSGSVYLTAVTPDATQTGSVANPQVDISAVASYRVD